MDYTGLNKFTAYEVERPLTDEERRNQLRQKDPCCSECADWLSVVRINSTYLELVDRWYPNKGSSVWLGGIFSVPFAVFSFLFAFSSLQKEDPLQWVTGLAFSLILLLFSIVGFWVIRFDAFRETHYPIRINRREREVYAFRPDGYIIKAKWDDLFFCKVKNKLTMGQVSYDIRAHVLDVDGLIVEDTFTLGYPDSGGEEDVIQLWEYIRRYMEEKDGVKDDYNLTTLCPPVDGRREGLAFGIVRVFAATANRLLPQLMTSPIAALNVLGRWFAMYTSKVPRWPEEIEAVCQIDPDDPYQKDWRSNGKYDFWELGWPVICFLVGLVVLGGGVVWLVNEVSLSL